jgi:hypothetical protein
MLTKINKDNMNKANSMSGMPSDLDPFNQGTGDSEPMMGQNGETLGVNTGQSRYNKRFSKPSSLANPFSPTETFNAESIYGNDATRMAAMRPASMLPPTPLSMADQNGDGKITYGDVITAKIEGYKGSPAKLHKGDGKTHPGEYFIAEPKDNTPPPKTRQEKKNIIMGEFRDVMRKRNDSLKKLPVKNINHLPSFNGDLDAKIDWYKDPKNKPKIDRINKSSKPIRDKVRVDLKNV